MSRLGRALNRLRGRLRRDPATGDLVELCRRTTLEGWEHLQQAEAAGHGVLIATPEAGGHWRLAARALAEWAAPVYLLLPDDPEAARRLLAAAEGLGLADPVDPDVAGAALAAGGKLLWVDTNDASPSLDRSTAPAIPAATRLTVTVDQTGPRYRLRITPA